MKKLNLLLILGLIALITMSGCAQVNKGDAQKEKSVKPILQKEATLDMNKDSLDLRIVADITKQVIERKIKMTEEAISAIEDTQNLLQEVQNGKQETAIKKGERLIGKLEVLLASDPSLSMIPVNVNYQKKELITDIETVRKSTELAQKAMNDGYYQLAAKILNDLKSEMVINTYLLPTATYPQAIKLAVIALKENNKESAEIILREVLGTIVIKEDIQPLPVLYAEQMIIEAAIIDKENHDNIDQVLNLLNNAAYQLVLAEELGYGKKDKDYKELAESIKILKKSVGKKENSQEKFDSLKTDIKDFKNEIFGNEK